MRPLSDYLAKDFAALGLPKVAEHRITDGRQIIKFANGATIDVGPFASDAEIMQGAREAFAMTDDNIETAATVPSSADKIPAVVLAAPVEKPKDDGPKSGGIMAAGYKPGTLKGLIADLNREGQSLMQEVAEEAGKVKKAHGHLRSARDDLRAYRDGVMADLGQFSNMADEA